MILPEQYEEGRGPYAEIANLKAEIAKLQSEIAAMRPAVEGDQDVWDIVDGKNAEIAKLRAALEEAYDDAKQAAVNPFLADELSENDGPWELQKKIGIAIDFRKKLALAKEGK